MNARVKRITTSLVILIALTIVNSQAKLINLHLPSIYAQEGGVATGETLATNPKIREITVTATVPDIIAPSTPILISPPNTSLINDSTPTFIWQRSSDNVGVDHYQLFLDGNLLYDNIPTSSTNNSEYSLVYNSTSGQYSLTPQTIINDGVHSWQILAFDQAGNSSASVIWTFTIDTLAPSFIIAHINSDSYYISAQDINSVPEEVIRLKDNSPIFSGTGETSATVQVTITIPNQANQTINFNIDTNGEWSFTLGILPRDTVVTLNFIITDQAGNISLINDLKILIIQDYIIIPPTHTPIPTSPIVTPIPSPTTKPVIKIPVLPPKEIIKIIVDKVIPKVIQDNIPQIVKDINKVVAPVGVAVATLALPTLSFLALFFQLGQQLSWQLILKILQALGLLPPKEPQGIVFDAETNKPVPFALLTITSMDNKIDQRIIETVVTDVHGIYQGIKLPVGKYIINVTHQEYTFPTTKTKPLYLTIQEYYRGETFKVTDTSSKQLFMIPIDKIDQEIQHYSFGQKLRQILQNIKFINLFWPLFTFSTIITILYPTWFNKAMLGLYCLVLIKKMVEKNTKANLSGYTIDEDSQPLADTIIRITNPQKGELVVILTTNKQGYFSAHLEANKYQIQVNKSNYQWQTASAMSYQELDLTKEKQHLNFTLKKIN